MKKKLNQRVTTPHLLKHDCFLSISNSKNPLIPPIQVTSHPTLHEHYVHEFLSSLLPMSLPTKPITHLKIIQIIKNLHPKKAPGHDLIKLILFITYIYN